MSGVILQMFRFFATVFNDSIQSISVNQFMVFSVICLCPLLHRIILDPQNWRPGVEFFNLKNYYKFMTLFKFLRTGF